MKTAAEQSRKSGGSGSFSQSQIASDEDGARRMKVNERSEICEKHGPYISKLGGVGKQWERWMPCEDCNDELVAKQNSLWREEERRNVVERLIKNLQIPARFKNKTLQNFNPQTEEQRNVLDHARSFVSRFDKNLETGMSLIFAGSLGTGKTHVACGMLFAVATAGHSGLYVTVSDLIRGLRSSWRKSAPQTEEEALARYVRPHLLVIDEVGMQFGSDAERVQMFDVLNGRYNALHPTILISNLNMDGLTEYLGDRVIDRMRENGGHMVIFRGESWRAKQQCTLASH